MFVGKIKVHWIHVTITEKEGIYGGNSYVQYLSSQLANDISLKSTLYGDMVPIM